MGGVKHNFSVTTYTKPTYCDVCSKLLWGIVKQGMQCCACSCNIHKSCQSQILVSCTGSKKSTIRSMSSDKSFIKEVVEMKFEDGFKDLKIPLNLLTTSRNFTRFASRIGPLVEFQNELIDVMTWTNPGKTIAWMLSYGFLCYYPRFLSLVPWLIVLYQIGYYYVHDREPFDVSQSQYVSNMQFIQNHMGLIADSYDSLSEKYYRLIDWSDGSQTRSTLIQVLGGLTCTYFIVNWIPINLILLAGGIFVFLMNTTWFRVVSMSVPSVVGSRIVSTYQRVLESSDGKSEYKVLIFENQRWWAGLGWIPFLLKTERSAWSDETGTIAYSHINEHVLPKDAEWSDPEWKIHETWTIEGMDEQGWQYSDNAWQGIRPHCTLGSFTRKRCWIRRMKKRLIETIVDDGEGVMNSMKKEE